MAKRRYALERGGPKQLQLRWGWGMRKFEVSLGPASWKIDRKALAAGARIVLPDGSTLLVQRPARPWYSMDSRSRLVVERDGLPVPGSDGDPRVVGRGAARLILLFGVLRVLFVGVALAARPREVTAPAYLATAPWIPLVGLVGLILVVLGILAAFGKRLPIAIAAGLFVVEGLAASAGGGLSNPMGVLIQVLVIVHLIRAWRRMEPREPQPSLASVFE